MRYTQPQSGPGAIDRSNSLGAKVIEAVPLSGNNLSVVSRAQVVYGSSGTTRATIKGQGLRGQGATARASVPINLSKYSVISVAFWLYWDAFANDDAFAMEFTPNTNNTAGAFYIDPNSSAGGGKFAVVPNGSGANGNGMLYDRPTAGTWHRYCATIDIRNQFTTLAIDGRDVSGISAGASPNTGTSFADSTLFILSRSGNSLLGTGNIQDIVFYSGALSAAEKLQDYQNPYQVYASPARRILATSPVTGITANIAWTEDGESFSVAGLLTNRVAAAWSEAGETSALNAVLTNRAAASWAEAGETTVVTSVITDRGALAWTEQGETMAITAVAQEPAQASIQAAIAWTEAGETSAVVARLLNRAAIAQIEQGDVWNLTAYAEIAPIKPTVTVTVCFIALKRDYNMKTINLTD